MPNENKENLHALRHTAEHILHQAMKELYPKIHLAMGPATDDGFYFDFDPNGVKVSEEDFPKIEKRMQELIDLSLPVTRHEISVEEARKLFAGNPYKQEWIDGIEAKHEKVTIYWTGEAGKPNSMVDLCAGPHVDSTGEIKAFKLLKIAGAYWHGDEKNKMLTRIYGTAFASTKEMEEYLNLQEEAKKRDHKILGPKLDLFTFSNLVGSGLPLWTPKGTIMRNLLDGFVWELRQAKGYQKVAIPHITKKELYETSGHWKKFANELFKITTREGHEFAMKPMNCPHHTQIYAHLQRSYRDLPQRYAETTMVYRDEQTGELSGLSRVRCITQDDAHVFCREAQLKDEVYAIWDIIENFYKGTGFPNLKVRLSLHDPEKMGNYLGTEADWQKYEDQLRDFAKERQVEYFEAVGEAAFYGPKLDFISQDSLGREWQVATIQADRNMPKNFELTCVNEKGEKEPVVMLHAAIMGSIERFMSILIEHYAGAFPIWLCPVQVKIISISQESANYAQTIAQSMIKADIRVEIDGRDESMQGKIREAQLQKIPYMIIVGGREEKEKTISVRLRSGKQLNSWKVEELIERIGSEVERKQDQE